MWRIQRNVYPHVLKGMRVDITCFENTIAPEDHEKTSIASVT